MQTVDLGPDTLSLWAASIVVAADLSKHTPTTLDPQVNDDSFHKHFVFLVLEVPLGMFRVMVLAPLGVDTHAHAVNASLLALVTRRTSILSCKRAS